jgi:hypothetical protein
LPLPCVDFKSYLRNKGHFLEIGGRGEAAIKIIYYCEWDSPSKIFA